MIILIVVVLRLLVPLAIFRWPLAGGLIAMLLDGADVILADALWLVFGGPQGMGSHYHSLDKWLDIYYLSFEAAVSWRWTEALAQRTSIALFAYRLIGVGLFELTGIRKFLFIFPNLFENFFLYCVAARRFFPHFFPKNPSGLVIVLVLLYIPKFFQEWLLHVSQAHPWNWFKDTFISPFFLH